MRKINWALIPSIFAGIEAALNSAASIFGSLKQLGWRKVLCAFVVLALLAGASWYFFVRSTPALRSAPSAALADVPQEKKQITAPVVVYKPEAKKKLNLPAPVQRSEAHVVLNATDLPASKHERTVSTVLDSTSGEVTSYVEEKPLPLFAEASTGSLAIYAGIKGIEPAIRAEVRQDFYSIKGVKVGAIASADRMLSGRTDTFIGVGARYEW